MAEQVPNAGVPVTRLAGVGFGPGFGVSRCKLDWTGGNVPAVPFLGNGDCLGISGWGWQRR